MLEVCVAGEAELRIPAPGLRAVTLFREGATVGSRGPLVESRIEDGRIVFRSSGGTSWYHAVPAARSGRGATCGGGRSGRAAGPVQCGSFPASFHR